MSMLSGIDLSNNNDTTSGDAGIKGYAFVIVKASEGLHTGDSKHAHFVATARSLKKLIAHYHFGHPLQDAVGEAEHFLSLAGAKPGEGLALDLEATEGTNAQRLHYALTWLAHVQGKTGVKALVYTYKSYLTGMLSAASPAQAAELRSYPLWIADPSAAKGRPSTEGWKTWALHQYGISGGLDVDVLNGDARTWAGFSIPQPKPTPVPAPKPVPKPAPKPNPAPRLVVDLSNVIRAFSAYPHNPAVGSITAIQRALTAEGLYKGRIDGVAGPSTKAAYKAWQTRLRPHDHNTGIPGAGSLGDLGRVHGFSVKG